MHGKVTLCILLIPLLICFSAHGSGFIKPGARAMGMGGAFIPLADDAWGAWWNPAGILRSNQLLVGAEYSSLYPNMSQNSIHFGAVSYVQPVSRFIAMSAGVSYLGTSELYAQGEVSITFAFRPGFYPVSFGITGRYLFREYISNEFTFYDPMFAVNGRRGMGIGLDFGFQAELGRMVTVAGVARNLTRPDLGIGSEDRLPMEFSLGASFYPQLITPVIQIDYGTEKVDDNIDLDFSLGLEKWIGESNNWGIRAGYTIRSLGLENELTAGLSARYDGSFPVEFNYAAAIPLNDLASTWGRHRAGLSFRLGGDSWAEEETRMPLPPMVDRRVWNTDTDMYEFSLWARKDVTGDSLSVAQYDQIPLNSTIQLDVNQFLYAYFPAWCSVEKQDIRDFSVAYRVPRYWLEQHNLELRLVRLFRVLPDNTLERMPSALVDEDEASYYFEASVDEVSDFLITARPAELVMLDPRMIYEEVDSVDILEATLTFRVDKLWMDENRIDPATIGLSRIRGGIPLDIACTQVNEDLEYIYYETDPINLFQFVIVATEREGLPVSKIYFDHSIAAIREDQIPDLDRIVETLTHNPGVFVSIEGHADSDGTFSYNVGLSEERAHNIVEYLTERLEGLNIEIEASWFGERRPAAANDTESGRRLNRRVEIVILRR